MLDYLLRTAQAFEREHGSAPDIIEINPMHYEQLTRCCPELFAPGSRRRPGFRLVIVPSSVLAHPRASLRAAGPAADTPKAQAAGDVAGCSPGAAKAAGL